MKRSTLFFSKVAMAAVAVWSAVGLSACGYQQQTSPPDTRAADESAIRALALEWARAASAKDLEKTLSFYAEGASVFPPNQPIATTKEQRRKVWTDSFAIPGFGLEIFGMKVEASRAGDLAYETGSFTLTANDKKGKPTAVGGKYVVVWKKQTDGSWKAVADIWNVNQ